MFFESSNQHHFKTKQQILKSQTTCWVDIDRMTLFSLPVTIVKVAQRIDLSTHASVLSMRLYTNVTPLPPLFLTDMILMAAMEVNVNMFFHKLLVLNTGGLD